MTAQAIVLADHVDGAELRRWFLAAVIVAAAHGALMAAYLIAPSSRPDSASMAPAVIVDLAPLPVAPSSPTDLAPGPEMVEQQQQQEQRPPDPPPLAEPQFVEPLPKVETPAVITLPPPAPKAVKQQPQEKPIEQKVAPQPEAKPIVPPEIEPPESVRAQRRPPAPRTTANPRTQNRPAPVARAPSPGSAESGAATTNWRDLVVARLQRAKRYPSGAELRREHGVVTLSFSVNRSGQVLGRRIARSSGYSALDQEVLSMIERAQPLPPFPPGMTQSVIHLTVPIQFALR